MTDQYTQEPDIAAKDLPHIDLWQYFESRGSGVKDTMFNVVTWIVGFAAVILGIAIKETLDFGIEPPFVTKPYMLVILCAVGLLVVVYARVLIGDFGAHINRNFDRADRSRDTSKSLLEILDIKEKNPQRNIGLPNICKYVLRVVWVFGGLFAVGEFLAIVDLLTNALPNPT